MEEVIETSKSLGLLIVEVILTISFCIQYFKKYNKKPEVSKMIPKQNEIDLDIISKMDYTKEILNADRIHVYEFHNGEHYSDYRSALKFSCSYEVVKAGLLPVRNNCINLPISIMPRFINKITTEGKFYCKNIDDLRDLMPSTCAFKREVGIKSFYDVAIRNVEGRIIGFVAIHWGENTTPSINEEVINKLVWSIEENIQKAIRLSK